MSEKYSDAEKSLLELRELLHRESQEGRAVLSSPYENPVCSISVDESVPCLWVSWKSYATSAQLRFILEHVLQQLKRHQLTSILGDDFAIPVIHSEDQAWIANSWFPRAIEAGWQVAANRVPKSYFGRLTTTNVQATVADRVVIRSFVELDEARNWLRSFIGRPGK